MTYSMAQQKAFRDRLRRGLSRCWTIPTAHEREINRRKMLEDYRESQPEPEPEAPPRPQPIPADYQQLRAQVNYLTNKVMEKRATDKRGSGDYEPF